jgi:lipopolysaccharide transport system permease protein
LIENILKAFLFAKRDFKERYVGTNLGQFWYILSPLVMIFIYTVIFSDFMKMKLNVVDSSYSYSIYLISGLFAWTSFSTIIMRLNTIFFDKSHLIKKINIPIYTFMISIILSEFMLFTIAMILAIGFLVIISHPVTLTFLWLIPIMIIQTIFALGVGVIFALFTPFFKDLKEIVPIMVQLWFWVTPIIYLNDMIENKYPSLLKFNPFYHFLKIYQNIFLYSKAPTIKDIGFISILTIITLILAIYLYKKMVGEIKDII